MAAETKGFIKLFRKMLDWEWYTDVNTTKIFIHCLLRANHATGRWMGIEIEPGQFVTSLPKLAEENGMSVQQVRTALKHLMKTGDLSDDTEKKIKNLENLTGNLTGTSTGYLTGRKIPKGRIITISHWSEYQELTGTSTGTSTGYLTGNQQGANRQLTANKNNKNNKNERNNIYAHFEIAWEAYPRKMGKSKVSDKQKEKLEEIGKEELLRAVNRYKDEVKGTDPRFIMYGSTFFNSRYVDYLDANYEPPEPQEKPANSFHNFDQRNYDWASIEKRLTQEWE